MPAVIVSSVEIQDEIAQQYGVVMAFDKSTMTPQILRRAVEGALDAA